MRTCSIAAVAVAFWLGLPAPCWSIPSSQVDLITTSGPTYRDDQWILNLASPVVASVTYTVVPDDEVGSNIENATAHWVDAINADPVAHSLLVAALAGTTQFTLTWNAPGVAFNASVDVIEASQSDFNESAPLIASISVLAPASIDVPEPGPLLFLGLAIAGIIGIRSGRQWRRIGAALGVLAIAPNAVQAAPFITYDLPGTLTVVSDPSGVLAANNPSITVGAAFDFKFTFDYSAPPTFPNNGGVTSWWGYDEDHSSMRLTIGSSFWQTVQRETSDAIYVAQSTPGAPYEAIGSDHHNTAIDTNVTPAFAPVSGVYWMNWSINNPIGCSPCVDPAVGNFPLTVDMAQWSFRRVFLNVSEVGPHGETSSYYLEGRFSVVGSAVPEPSSIVIVAAGLMLLVASTRRGGTRPQ